MWPRSNLISSPWPDIWTSGGRATAASSWPSHLCRSGCRICTAANTSSTPSPMRWSWDWRPFSICCWKTWSNSPLAERQLAGPLSAILKFLGRGGEDFPSLRQWCRNPGHAVLLQCLLKEIYSIYIHMYLCIAFRKCVFCSTYCYRCHLSLICLQQVWMLMNKLITGIHISWS